MTGLGILTPTGAWYGMVALPPFLALMLLGPAHVAPRALSATLIAFVLLFSTAYYLGTFGEQLPYQTAGLARGVAAAVAEVQVHHALLRWPVLPSLLAEGALLLGLVYSAGRPALTPIT